MMSKSILRPQNIIATRKAYESLISASIVLK